MSSREGSLEAPERQPLDWKNPEFYDRDSLNAELERVFDICHGCRRCVSLCDSFPTLFDLVDESDTLEVDGVDKADYNKVVEQCFLCDLCAETKCPYVPPHEWAVDFPHLMLRGKAQNFVNKDTKWRDRIITSTDPIFDTLSTPGLAQMANAAAGSKTLRKAGEALFGIHQDAPLPTFEAKALSKRIPAVSGDQGTAPTATDKTTGKVAIYVTCYGDHNEPKMVEDLIAVLNHNNIATKVLQDAKCCGMPKLELGDLPKVEKMKDANLPVFLQAIADGYDIIAPIPSCVLMYKQELPLMFPGDQDVATIQKHFFDPFEYLMLRQKAELIDQEFTQPLGKVAYHVACHQRVQNFGMKTREFLNLIPGTEVTAIERCSGHDGTYAVKAETYEKAKKIARPVVRRVTEAEPDTFGSDCPMAGRLIADGLDEGEAEHPISMVRRAYGI
ncbi:MAG: heterodisulfide reductase-related iron-sulfur binding cluster [Pseudomonadota bacterium]|nr:heterodisulfide reductase-related iron-sulfur binding cluster [Pseudomonadota bacterium]MEC7250609.1 heterodisulfide reductase-related iron-sulfur binding cluster [Pseudomonadota bacterium]MEC7663079.1 heterodisulfide reductase-related iron-sulfur binding cluster [Pseudomonadota bacterium]MEC7956800.1 heterodisulfide reductase-related iron-sulfur binding cluster [Pseudomonadota bacterium]